ncbi:hypothetical protein KR018_006964 [Drosophila ironensis]|nr:hypothetical protein KR018_006964 [Drosophila ironensis]
MLHDVLLACMSQNPDGVRLQAFLDNEAVDKFLHPCEREILADIVKIVHVYSEVIKYRQGLIWGKTDDPSEKDFQGKSSAASAGFGLSIPCPFAELKRGFYQIKFGKGIEDALESFYAEILRLEEHCLKTQSPSLCYVHHALQAKLPLLRLLQTFIREIEASQLSGCAMLGYLYHQSDHGDPELEIAARKVIRPVQTAFFSGIAHWMLFGAIDDVHSEFFIKFTPNDPVNSSTATRSSHSSLLNAERNSDDFIWQYEVNHQQLPDFMSAVVAEKILFVGQTVLVFQMERDFNSKKKFHQLEVRLSKVSCEDIDQLWKGREAEFFKLIEKLAEEDRINPFHIEETVNRIKKFVSMRLTDIAVNEVDLAQQLSLIRDFYLLGRGEFYMEFLHQLNRSESRNIFAAKTKNYVRCFQIAATVVGITEELEHFTLRFVKTEGDPDESCEFQSFQCLQLKYTFQWPLNLLFSPKAIEQYNIIFRYLLIIRNLHFQLQKNWKAKGATGNVNIKVMNLRNHLLFFLNNLQYYIQSDVIEIQFRTFIDTVQTKADFEDIQKAHTVFLANVLSHCFLATDSKEPQMNITAMVVQNPIYGAIQKLFGICESFSHLSVNANTDQVLEEVDRLEEQFGDQIGSLLHLFADTKLASHYSALSQLLMRLDFNYWFSKRQKPVVLHAT